MQPISTRNMDERRVSTAVCKAVVLTLGLVVLTVATVGAAAEEYDAARHFKGKSIRLMVDFKPGGGTDLQELVIEASRSFKEQLPRYTEIRQQVYDRIVR